MITHLNAVNFSAVPYLETSSLMNGRKKGIRFSIEKPNVIVGENGSGKSALLKALALHTLTYFSGRSALDKNYIDDKYWREVRRYYGEYEYLPGLQVKSNFAPALFYRPGFLPGDECDLSHSMMMGYFNEARRHGELVNKKSSGQQSQALLTEIRAVLNNEMTVPSIGYANWTFGDKPRALASAGRTNFIGSYDYKAEILRKQYAVNGEIPVVLLDEPEQSLDSRAEALFWEAVANVDCKKVQVIGATHSWYPILHPERFNIIEATPGYLKDLNRMLKNFK